MDNTFEKAKSECGASILGYGTAQTSIDYLISEGMSFRISSWQYDR